MQFTCYSIGKTKEAEYRKFIQHYEQKLKHYNPFQYIELDSVKNASKLNKEQLKKEEGKLIFSKISKSTHLVLLDEKGKTFSSQKFSHYLDKKLMSGAQEIVFLIGGAYGFSEEIYQRANEKIALSEMTFTHQMVRVIFLEQLYRGFSILRGEKYHH